MMIPEYCGNCGSRLVKRYEHREGKGFNPYTGKKDKDTEWVLFCRREHWLEYLVHFESGADEFETVG